MDIAGVFCDAWMRKDRSGLEVLLADGVTANLPTDVRKTTATLEAVQGKADVASKLMSLRAVLGGLTGPFAMAAPLMPIGYHLQRTAMTAGRSPGEVCVKLHVSRGLVSLPLGVLSRALGGKDSPIFFKLLFTLNIEDGKVKNIRLERAPPDAPKAKAGAAAASGTPSGLSATVSGS